MRPLQQQYIYFLLPLINLHICAPFIILHSSTEWWMWCFISPRTTNVVLILPAHAGRKHHTFPLSAVWNCQGISRLVGARAKPGVPGARADCPPSQPLAWLFASRLLSSVPIEKSWSRTSIGESTLIVFAPFYQSCALDRRALPWYLTVAS